MHLWGHLLPPNVKKITFITKRYKKMGLSALGAAALGLADTAVSYFGNKKSQNRSIDAQNALFEKEKEWEKEKMLNAYTWTMQDLEKAGINPTLLYGNGGSANMAGSTGASPVGTPSIDSNIAGSMTSALKVSKELGLMDAQKENINADTDLKGAQAGKTQAETDFQKTQNKYQENLIQLEAQLREETNREIRTRIQKILQESSQIEKDIIRTEKEIDILKSQGRIAEANAKTRENNRRAIAILEMTESATKSIGNIMGALKGTSAMPTHGNFNSNSVHWMGY